MDALRAVVTEGAPAPIGPYSQGISAAGFFFSAGQIGLDPVSGRLVGEDAASQARRAFENLSAVLAAAGLDFSDVVKTTVFLADMDDFRAVNDVYGEHFGEPYPARSTVQAGRLPKDARVEIEVIARLR